MAEKIKNLLLYGGTTKRKYDNAYQSITEANRRYVTVFSLIVSIGMFIMVFASFFTQSLVKNRPAYLICAVICAILVLLDLFISNNHSHITYLSVYVFIAVLLGFGIDLGTFIEPNQMSLSFAVILFAVPLIFIDRPVHMDLAILVAIIVYYYFASLTQTPTMLGYNLSNIIPYGIISMIFSTYMMIVKINHHVLSLENKYLIESDQMTGLLNRRSFERHLQQFRTETCPSGIKICEMDLNGLKSLNDSAGHDAGDELIRGAADCIRKVFGQYGECYRIGGDEFVAILDSNSPDPDELRQNLKSTCDEFHKENIPPLSISVGIVATEFGDDIDLRIKEADREMYKCKAEYYSSMGIDRRRKR